MHSKVFEGIATALYTPFTDGKIDYQAFSELVDEQLAGGVSALVFMGTTGESATITDSERTDVIRFAVEKVNGRIPVIIGCGSNCTLSARKQAEKAKSLGADAALCVTPYYNKCTQYGLYRHYEEIAKANLPVIVYNVPSRTGVNALPETLKDLAEIDSVCGVKEANPDKAHIKKVFEKVKDRIAIYSGNDNLNVYFYSLGASGAISVASNIIPRKIVDIFNNFTTNYDTRNFDKELLDEFYEALFIEVNPIPVKTMVSILGKRGGELRLPLTKADKTDAEYLEKILRKLLLR